MKTLTALAAAALCGFAVLVSGCSEESSAQKPEKQVAAELGKAADAVQKAADASKKDAAKQIDSLKKSADAAKK